MAFPNTLTNAVDRVTPIVASHLNNLEAKVGVDGSTVSTSLDYLLKNAASIEPGHKHSKLWASDGSLQVVAVDTAGKVSLGKQIWVGEPKYGTTFQDIITAIGSTACTLNISGGTHSITTDLTIPSNINLKVYQGAVLAIANTKTLTINGPFEAGLYQTFSWTGTGKVVFGSGSVNKAYPEWWGAVGDGTTDDTAPVQACYTAVGANAWTVFQPGRIYAVDQIQQTIDNQKFWAYGATILHNGSNKPALNIVDYNGLTWFGGTLKAKQSAINPTTAVIYQTGAFYVKMRDLEIVCGDGTTYYANYGLQIIGSAGHGNYYSSYFDVVIRYAGAYALVLDGYNQGNFYVNDNCFYNLKIQDSAAGINFAGAQGNWFYGGEIEGCQKAAITYGRSINNVVHGFWIEDVGQIFAIDWSCTDCIGTNIFTGSFNQTPPRPQWSYFRLLNWRDFVVRGAYSLEYATIENRFWQQTNGIALSTGYLKRYWSPSTYFSLYMAVQPTSTADGWVVPYWECTTAGTSGTTEPSWPANPNPGDTVSDGTVVWTYRNTENNPSFYITANGAVAFGRGGSDDNYDVLRSDMYGRLYTNSTFWANGSLATKVKAGIPTDADMTLATNGGLIIDSTDGRLYFRYNSTWHYINKTAGFEINKDDAYDHLVGPEARFKKGDIVLGIVTGFKSDGAPHCEYVSLEQALRKLSEKSTITPTVVSGANETVP